MLPQRYLIALFDPDSISQICYCGQISLQSAPVNCSFSDNLTPLEATFILLAIVHYRYNLNVKILKPDVHDGL